VGAEHLRRLGYVALATGIGSAFFHASETLIGRFADWAGKRVIRLFFWGNFLLGMGLLVPSSRHPTIYYVIETTLCCVLLEAILFVKQGKNTRYAWLVRYWLVFLVAYGLWMLDIRGTLCDPGNHWMSGHAAWHLLDAVAMYFLFEYYRQFRVLTYERPST
jgi:hypothetical protein